MIKLIKIGTKVVRIAPKLKRAVAQRTIKCKNSLHQTLSWQELTSQRGNPSDAAIQIPVSSDSERRETSIVTSNGLRMAEAAGDVPVVVGGLGRCDRYKSIYQTLGVAGQKDFVLRRTLRKMRHHGQ